MFEYLPKKIVGIHAKKYPHWFYFYFLFVNIIGSFGVGDGR